MKNKLLATLLLSATSLLHGMEQETKHLHTIQHNLELIREVFTKSPRPNETRVSMWEAQSISTQPTIQEPLILSTTGLIGCVAATLHVKYNNGDQYAGMTHYPPTSNEDHHNAVQDLCLEALKNQNKSKKIVATHFFFSASNNKETTPVHNLLTEQEKETTPLYQLLSNTVHTTLQETGTIKTHLVPYDISDVSNLINLFLDNDVQERDIEMILYPDKATLRVKDQIIDVSDNASEQK